MNMYILLSFCAPASSSDKISKSLLWSDHGCLALFSFTRLGLSFPFFFLSGWQLFGLSHSVRDFGRGHCIMSLPTALLLLPFISFSRSLYFRCPSFWSKQYLSLSYRAKPIPQTQTPLHYTIQLHHKQKREFSAAFGVYLPYSADWPCPFLNGTDSLFITQIRDIMLWQVYIDKQNILHFVVPR